MNDNSVKYLDIRTLPLIKSVDYKALLEKYVQNVLECEGWLYDDPAFKAGIKFTEGEKQELWRIKEEWRSKYE